MFYIFLVLTIGWFIFMTYLSHQDGEHTGKASRELAEKLSVLDFLGTDVGVLNGKLRRVAHVVVYAVLVLLLGITLEAAAAQQIIDRSWGVWVLIAVIVWAWADEATKPLVQGRHFSWFDLGLNLIGVVIGVVIGMVVV